MENGSYRNEILRIEGLRITQYSTYPVFILLFLTYLFIMVSNLGIVMMIAMEKALHKPMYLLFCNLPVNDALSATVVLPGLLKDILAESDRYISYAACVIQAFGVHSLSTSAHTILIIMALDRYVAICNPLRYNTIMTNKMVVRLSVIAWVTATVPIVIILALTVRLSHCTSTISNPYCDNPSLFKLSCENLLLNQIFGLISAVMLWTTSISCISLTYLKIAHVCLKNQNSTMKSKAIKTCSTHLILYLILLGCSCTVIILHRFSDYEELRNLASILYFVIPTSLNPVIYGLQTKEIRHWIEQIFLRRKVIPR
ncbi:olfactory receptor 52N5-like [Pangasianodon hypophthalmus]|uniref:olfactory receptor 52N5-like n=1 Tax=Pangasianodon hypophthalmus TaxID=310915 RepID=UPI002307A4A8|nr:olfactory receptor 52N5-like [Pangasianodon hypophthalmus]